MMDRRAFLKSTAGSAAIASSFATVGEAAPAGKSANSENPAAGQVPDTLDLAHHGALSINGILGSLDPKVDYETVFWNILDVHPAYMLHWSSMVSGVQPKYVEALPMLRQMSGSKQHLDIEKGFLEAMTRNASEDGLIYDRALPSRPWNVGVYYGRKDWNEDYANMAGAGRYLAGLTFMYQATGDEVWKQRARKTAERMLELAVVEGDKAWYPNPGLGNDFSYPRRSGWTTRKPPLDPKEGAEGATMFYLYQPLRGFTRYYVLTGDDRFLALSRKFLNTGQLAAFWQGMDNLDGRASYERGHFKGHLHGNLAAIRGVLDYALVANDQQLKMWVRDCYEWVRQMGIPRLGVLAHGKGGIWEANMEGCVTGDITALAVALSDAGLGDYWDDVESIARNALVSAQATDIEELKRVSEQGKARQEGAMWGGAFDSRFRDNNQNRGQLQGQEIYENVLDRTIGAFSHLDGARYQKPMMMSCCTANGSQGFYFAWEAITRRSGNAGVVNLWLNRRSPWLDVWSWLPYEGKLMVANKGLREIVVRKPGWAHASQITCRINGKQASPVWIGNRLLFSGLRGNEQLSIEVPVQIDKASYSLVNLNDPMHPDGLYECEFKGNTGIRVTRLEPGADPEERNWYRLFQRDRMRADQAPLVAAPSYVHPEKIVRWVDI
jgi:hypothetical protein